MISVTEMCDYFVGEAESGLERLHACAEKELQAFFDAEDPSGDSEEFIKFRTKLAGLTRYLQFDYCLLWYLATIGGCAPSGNFSY